MVICGPTVIGLPIGSHVSYGFVFWDDLKVPIPLVGLQFVFHLASRYSKLVMEFTTDSNPGNLYVEENATITQVGKPSYVADRLILALIPDITRQVPFGALTNWEIERRKDGDQRNWGAGMFNGYGGLNPDNGITPPPDPGTSDEMRLQFTLADEASQIFTVPSVPAGSLVRIESYSTIVASHDWFADALVDVTTGSIAVELGIVKTVTVNPASIVGVSDPDGSLNLGFAPGQLKVRNRTGAPATGVVRIALDA